MGSASREGVLVARAFKAGEGHCQEGHTATFLSPSFVVIMGKAQLHVCMHAHTHTHTHVCMHAHTHMHTLAHVRARTHARMHKHTLAHSHMQ